MTSSAMGLALARRRREAVKSSANSSLRTRRQHRDSDVTDAARVSNYPDNDAVTTLVAAALFTPTPADLLARAATFARSTTHRQLVAIAAAYVAGDADRVRVLASDHTSEHAGSVLVAWMTETATCPSATDVKDLS